MLTSARILPFRPGVILVSRAYRSPFAKYPRYRCRPLVPVGLRIPGYVRRRGHSRDYWPEARLGLLSGSPMTPANRARIPASEGPTHRFETRGRGLHGPPRRRHAAGEGGARRRSGPSRCKGGAHRGLCFAPCSLCGLCPQCCQYGDSWVRNPVCIGRVGGSWSGVAEEGVWAGCWWVGFSCKSEDQVGAGKGKLMGWTEAWCNYAGFALQTGILPWTTTPLEMASVVGHTGNGHAGSARSFLEEKGKSSRAEAAGKPTG